MSLRERQGLSSDVHRDDQQGRGGGGNDGGGAADKCGEGQGYTVAGKVAGNGLYGSGEVKVRCLAGAELVEPEMSVRDCMPEGQRGFLEHPRLITDQSGAVRLLFGTDTPFDFELGELSIRDTIRSVEEMAISETDREAIFEGNARRPLRL